MKQIVILGAGYAGVLTAKKLAKRLKKNEDVRITLIDRNPFHTMLTELHEVAAGRVDEDSIKISLQKVFAGRRVEVALDEIESVDFDEKLVTGAAKEYPYDYLVIAAGSQPTYFGVEGAKEHAFKLWSYDDAVLLREHIHNQFRKASRTVDAKERTRLLTFYVVGAGFTGVEMAGELAEYVPILCEKYEINPNDVTLCNVDILKRAVPILPEKLSAKVERRLTKMGVTVMLETGVVGIGPDYIETKAGEHITRRTAGTVVWTAGIESAAVTQQAAQTLESAGRGRIKTDEYLRVPDHPEIYVAGDNLMMIPEGEKAPVPQMVENCEQSAHTIAHNLTAAITGKGEAEAYRPKFHGVMVSIGGRYGVAHVGMPGHFFSLPSFLAMFAKHFINVIYFVQVLGWNKIFSYVRHEFFTIRNCRSFLGGHFSNRTPSFLLVPLRVWLGAVWTFEGVMKIVEGWFQKPMLSEFFGGANSWYNSILSAAGAPGVGGVTAAADAVASATSEAAGAVMSSGSVLFSFNIFGLFDAIFVSGSEIAQSTLANYAFRLDVPLLNWFLNSILLPNEGFQIFMQISIVVAEIAIGLALMGGLFTFPASAVSLVLQGMFVCTTGLYLSNIWMVVAAIAVLIGAGRTLGLDYYTMPFLKRHWKKIRFVRKWYLYND